MQTFQDYIHRSIFTLSSVFSTIFTFTFCLLPLSSICAYELFFDETQSQVPRMWAAISLLKGAFVGRRGCMQWLRISIGTHHVQLPLLQPLFWPADLERPSYQGIQGISIEHSSLLWPCTVLNIQNDQTNELRVKMNPTGTHLSGHSEVICPLSNGIHLHAPRRKIKSASISLVVWVPQIAQVTFYLNPQVSQR